MGRPNSEKRMFRLDVAVQDAQPMGRLDRAG